MNSVKRKISFNYKNLHFFNVFERFYVFGTKSLSVYKLNNKKLINIIKKQKVINIEDNKELINYFENNKEVKNIIERENYKSKTKIKQQITEIPKLVNNNELENIVFVISECCNMVCKYCYVSDWIKSNKLMDFRTIKKAIDFVLNTSKKENIVINYFGGEPLLNFDLIKDCVEYIKIDYKDEFKNTVFTVSTNLTLLNKKIMKFFIKYKFGLAVSLDGPKELHDRYRMFKNGEGSFDIVMNKLRMMYNFNREYFYSNVVYNVIASPPIDYLKLYNYFRNTKIFSKSTFARIGTVMSIGNPKFEEKYGIKLTEGLETKEKLFNIYKENVIKKDYINDKFLLALFNKVFCEIHNRKMSELPEMISERGVCIPGMARLLVNYDGIFYPCERGGFWEIGDIWNGFNYEKCYNLIRILSELRNEICLDCWAIRLCDLCYIGALNEDKIDLESRINQCDNIKRFYLTYLKRYVEIMEENPKAFESLREWAKSQKNFYPTL